MCFLFRLDSHCTVKISYFKKCCSPLIGLNFNILEDPLGDGKHIALSFNWLFTEATSKVLAFTNIDIFLEKLAIKRYG